MILRSVSLLFTIILTIINVQGLYRISRSTSEYGEQQLQINSEFDPNGPVISGHFDHSFPEEMYRRSDPEDNLDKGENEIGFAEQVKFEQKQKGRTSFRRYETTKQPRTMPKVTTKKAAGKPKGAVKKTASKPKGTTKKPGNKPKITKKPAGKPKITTQKPTSPPKMAQEYSSEEIVGGKGRPDTNPTKSPDDEEWDIVPPENYAEIITVAKQETPDNTTEDDPNEVEMGEMKGKAGLADTYYRWPYKMTIQIDPKLPISKRKEIDSAIWTLKEEMKCFRFVVVPHTRKFNKTKDFLYIKWKESTSACNSGLGRWGGKMVMTITNGCYRLYGTAMHELMHTLGFHHEHVRPDRDESVTIDYEQLKTPSQKAAWDVQKGQQVFGGGYDFDSILHYPLSKILKAKKGKIPSGVKVGQRDHLSEGDKIRLKNMYPCDKAPPTKKPIATTKKPTNKKPTTKKHSKKG